MLYVSLCARARARVCEDACACCVCALGAGLFNGLNLVAVGLVLARCVNLSHSLVALVAWAAIT